jgi:hypothetical protein
MSKSSPPFPFNGCEQSELCCPSVSACFRWWVLAVSFSGVRCREVTHPAAFASAVESRYGVGVDNFQPTGGVLSIRKATAVKSLKNLKATGKKSASRGKKRDVTGKKVLAFLP